MRRLRSSWRVAVILAASCPASLLAQTKAFPEAEGFGQFATGKDELDDLPGDAALRTTDPIEERLEVVGKVPQGIEVK